MTPIPLFTDPPAQATDAAPVAATPPPAPSPLAALVKGDRVTVLDGDGLPREVRAVRGLIRGGRRVSVDASGWTEYYDTATGLLLDGCASSYSIRPYRARDEERIEAANAIRQARRTAEEARESIGNVNLPYYEREIARAISERDAAVARKTKCEAALADATEAEARARAALAALETT